MATAIAVRKSSSMPKAKVHRNAEIEARPRGIVKSEIKTSWAGRVPHLKPGRYADGMPLHEIEYLACKLVLRPNRFRSRQSLFDFAKVLRQPADKCGVGLSTNDFEDAPLKIREVLFIDTKDFRLYNNAFILRRRIPYTDGFPSGEPEIVFKFRHPDIQKAAETDVRPQILGDHRVKFKCQALPLKDRLGGIRMLFSHNVQFPRSHVGETDADILQFKTIAKIFPVLDRLKKSPRREVRVGQRHHHRGSASRYRVDRFRLRTKSEDECGDLAHSRRT